jgi:hypothetical protein
MPDGSPEHRQDVYRLLVVILLILVKLTFGRKGGEFSKIVDMQVKSCSKQ